VLTMRLAKGARMLAPLRRRVVVRMGEATRAVVFSGRTVEVRF